MISLFRNRTEAVGHGWLDEHAEQWVEHGLVTSDQVDAIRDFEQHEAPEPRLSIVAELAVYLGSVLALMSGAMMVGPNWEALRTAGQMAIGLAVAALGFLAVSPHTARACLNGRAALRITLARCQGFTAQLTARSAARSCSPSAGRSANGSTPSRW